MKTTTVKLITGIGMIVAAIVLGLFVGLYWAFVGGIIDVVQAIKADNLPVGQMAWGVTKILFAPLLGWLSFFSLAAPGYVVLTK